MDVRFVTAALALSMVSGVAKAEQAPSGELTAAFQSICGTGETAQLAELARADALGWRVSGPGAPKGFNPATERISPSTQKALVLWASRSKLSSGETFDMCSVSSFTPVQGVVRAVRDSLGFAPALVFAHSATFYAIRAGTGWDSTAKMDGATVDAAKRSGRFYSIIVSDNGVTPPDGSEGYAAIIQLFHFKAKN